MGFSLQCGERNFPIFQEPITYLSGEPLAAHLALEGPLLGVGAHVDLQGGVAGEHLEAELAGRLAPRCKQIFHQWIYLGDREKER
jgi:hypothetical protein